MSSIRSFAQKPRGTPPLIKRFATTCDIANKRKFILDELIKRKMQTPAEEENKKQQMEKVFGDFEECFESFKKLRMRCFKIHIESDNVNNSVRNEVY